MLGMLTNLVTFIYYAFVAYMSVILIYGFVKSKSWEKEILYLVVLVPFLLRLFRLK